MPDPEKLTEPHDLGACAPYAQILADAVRAACEPQRIATHDPRRSLDVVNGQVTERVVAPPLRTVRLRAIHDVVEMAAYKEWANDPAVLFDGSRVEVFFDAQDWRESARLELVKSEVFKELEAWGPGGLRGEPKELARWLRLNLERTNQEAGVLRAALGQVEFSSTSRQHSDNSHGKDSFGKSVDAACNKTSEIPTSIRVNVPVYATPGADRSIPIELLVEIDPLAGRVSLLVAAGVLEEALDLAAGHVYAALREALPKETPLLGGRLHG